MTTNTDLHVAMPELPENIREGDPYDNARFEELCREHDIWGTAESAMCAVFWRAAIQQAAVPEGFKIVRVDPTMEMLDAAGEALYGYPREKAEEWAKLDKFEGQAQKGLDAYRAMLNASPAPPKQQPVHLGSGECGGVPLAGDKSPCRWVEEDPWGTMPGTYASGCGELWSFNDGGPKENSARFCHGCGRPVEVVPFPDEAEDEPSAPTGQMKKEGES